MSEPERTLIGNGLRSPRRIRLMIAAIVAFVLVVAIVAATRVGRGEQVHYFTATVERGEVRDVVDATGTVNAVITVQVGSQVSGTIAALHADFNSRVHKGEVIALIDPQLFEGTLKQAIADLENGKAGVGVAEANLTKARANEVQTKREYERAEQLAKETIGSQQALDLAQATYQGAKASVEAAEANVAQARAQVRQRKAAVSVARTNLAYTVIRSPIDGTVVARNVDVGQTVAASLQAPTVFTIAQDLRKMQVYAKVDESDVGKIRRGQPVAFKVDAFPKDVFHGEVVQVRMNPTTVQNVVTYDAIIEFENPDLKLFPGMTAYVTIPVATVKNVAKVPNAALRFRPPLPPEHQRALYAKVGIKDEPESDAAFPATEESSAGVRAGGQRSARPESAVVWKLEGGDKLEPVEIALGITDHTYTEVARVLAGHLAPGDDVITSFVKSNAVSPGTRGFGR
jgi:HlyD family secretion protein